MKTSASQKRILITCAGGTGPQYLANKLKINHEVFLTDMSEQNYGAHMGLPFFKVPAVSSADYIPTVQRIIEDNGVNVVVANSDDEVRVLKKLCSKLPDVICVAPDQSFIDLCLDKRDITEKLYEEGISALKVYDIKDDIEFPVAMKPNKASGSRGFHIVKNKKQLEGYFLLYECEEEDVIIQPYIEGVEYTVSVVVNNLNKVIGIVPKRIIHKRGITRAAVTEQNEIIKTACLEIVNTFKPRGPINVQLKLLDENVYIFEINPRLSTTVVLTDKAFGNEVELFLQYFDCEEIEGAPSLKEGVYLYRYDENFFVE
jgi:carbamoyl-phosphate synthase large subunit